MNRYMIENPAAFAKMQRANLARTQREIPKFVAGLNKMYAQMMMAAERLPESHETSFRKIAAAMEHVQEAMKILRMT